MVKKDEVSTLIEIEVASVWNTFESELGWTLAEQAKKIRNIVFTWWRGGRCGLSWARWAAYFRSLRRARRRWARLFKRNETGKSPRGTRRWRQFFVSGISGHCGGSFRHHFRDHRLDHGFRLDNLFRNSATPFGQPLDVRIPMSRVVMNFGGTMFASHFDNRFFSLWKRDHGFNVTDICGCFGGGDDFGGADDGFRPRPVDQLGHCVGLSSFTDLSYV